MAALQIPLPMLRLVLAQKARVCSGDCYLLKTKSLKDCFTNQKKFIKPAPEAMVLDAPLTFAADHFETAASMLRGSDADADCDNIGYTRDYICQWLDNMGAGARRGFNLASIKVSQQQMNPGGYAKHVDPVYTTRPRVARIANS